MNNMKIDSYINKTELKHLYLIGGTMGIGKTTACQELNKFLPNSIFLDGDSLFNMNPFIVNAETKAMVIRNIHFVLNEFLHCSQFENIIFCWVMHEQQIIDLILSGLDTSDCIIHRISLVCDQESLLSRLNRDIVNGIRTPDIIERSLLKLNLYNDLDTVKINVSEKTPSETVLAIINAASE